MSNSTRRIAPANACDCHIHIYDNRFPTLSGIAPLNCSASDYGFVQKHIIKTTRTVVVTPRNYVTNSQCTLDAIAQLGATVTRGIAVLHPTVTDSELKKLADGGICGIRFTVGNPSNAVTTVDMIEPLAKRIKELGWHVQVNMRGDQIVENADLLQRIETPIVFDHMARLPQPEGIRHAAFKIIRKLIDKGNTWVKLTSVVYSDSEINSIGEIASAFISIAPDRMIWGSDWPHGNKKEMPDDQLLFDRLSEWAPDESTWHRILVENPQKLYGFEKFT